MATEIHSVATVKFNADARLFAAVGAAARYFADAAGMESDAVAKLQADTLAACQAAFTQQTENNPQLSVEFRRFTDRIEIAVTQPGSDPITQITKRVAQSSPTAS